MENEIIVICAPSCAGKDTLARYLEKNNEYNFVISTTTRPMRPGEFQKNPYNFTNNENFENLINNDDLIEYRTYNTLVNNIPDTWYYGVEKSEIEDNKKYVCVLDTVGLIEFKKHFGDRVISFYLNVDDNVRKERCLLRGDFDEFEWNRRLADDKIRFSDEIINTIIDFVIEADNKMDWIIDEIKYHIENK